MPQRHIREQMILSEEDNVAKQSSALNNSSAFSLLDNNFECWQVYYNKLDFFCLESGSSVLLMNGHRHGWAELLDASPKPNPNMASSMMRNRRCGTFLFRLLCKPHFSLLYRLPHFSKGQLYFENYNIFNCSNKASLRPETYANANGCKCVIVKLIWEDLIQALQQPTVFRKWCPPATHRRRSPQARRSPVPILQKTFLGKIQPRRY